MQRILSFDLARGFTVLIMPSIHVVMLYSQPAVQNSLLGSFLTFIAEGPGAQLFMFLMGVSFTFSTRVDKRYTFRRAFNLLSAAYCLNFLKFIIPLGLGIFPDELLTELGLKNDAGSALFFLLIGDILHFAAIAYFILYIIYRLKQYPFWSFALAIVITIFSPLIWDLKTDITILDHIIVLFNGHPPQVFFPVFPWIIYPLMGLTLGFLLKNNNINYLMKKIGITGIGLIIASLCFPATTEINQWLPFYRTRPPDTIFHLGFVLLWLTVFHWLSRKIPANPFFKLLNFCSKHITAIYIIQWILIFWCLAFTGYLQLNLLQSLCWMLSVTLITLLLTWLINKYNVDAKNI